jgi:hypothetical protein
MSLEFKWQQFNKYRPRVYEPVEVGDDFHVVLHDNSKRRKLVSNGRVAFEIISRGRLYDRLLSEYEFERRLKKEPVVTVSTEPLRETVVPEEIVKPEPVEQAAEIVEVTTPAQTDVEEPYSLSADDWFECVVQRVSRNGRTLVLQLENATATCIQLKISESPGDHKCACLVGLVGACRLELVGDVYRATELQVLVEPTTLREEARVTWRDPVLNICKAERPCGCRIFIGGIADEAVYGEINVGDDIVFDLERSRSKGNWIGVRAKKISPEGRGVSNGI